LRVQLSKERKREEKKKGSAAIPRSAGKKKKRKKRSERSLLTSFRPYSYGNIYSGEGKGGKKKEEEAKRSITSISGYIRLRGRGEGDQKSGTVAQFLYPSPRSGIRGEERGKRRGEKERRSFCCCCAATQKKHGPLPYPADWPPRERRKRKREEGESKFLEPFSAAEEEERPGLLSVHLLLLHGKEKRREKEGKKERHPRRCPAAKHEVEENRNSTMKKEESDIFCPFPASCRNEGMGRRKQEPRLAGLRAAEREEEGRPSISDDFPGGEGRGASLPFDHQRGKKKNNTPDV